jgi:hypothetical protein
MSHRTKNTRVGYKYAKRHGLPYIPLKKPEPSMAPLREAWKQKAEKVERIAREKEQGKLVKLERAERKAQLKKAIDTVESIVLP